MISFCSPGRTWVATSSSTSSPAPDVLSLEDKLPELIRTATEQFGKFGHGRYLPNAGQGRLHRSPAVDALARGARPHSRALRQADRCRRGRRGDQALQVPARSRRRRVTDMQVRFGGVRDGDSPANGVGHRDSNGERPDLRPLTAELDKLLRTVADLRASRLRQLADARSARRGPAAPESPDPGCRARAGLDR